VLERKLDANVVAAPHVLKHSMYHDHVFFIYLSDSFLSPQLICVRAFFYAGWKFDFFPRVLFGKVRRYPWRGARLGVMDGLDGLGGILVIGS